MQNTKPSRAGFHWGETPNKGHPGLFYFIPFQYKLTTVWGAPAESLAPAVSLCPLSWLAPKVCLLCKGTAPVHSLLPRAPIISWHPEPNLQLTLQLHTELSAVNAFLSRTTKVCVCWLFTSSRVLYYPTCWVSCSLPLCIMNFVEWAL